MSKATRNEIGTVASLWRYPVKSMMGEGLTNADVTNSGLRGDRAYALIDKSDGKVASAKNPSKWPHLFDFHAVLAEDARTGAKLPPVRITLPDGTIVNSEQPDVHRIISDALKREVMLRAITLDRDANESSGVGRTATAEEYWPDIDGLDYRDTVTDFNLPEGTFFDSALMHLLASATLDRLHALYPQGRFEARRFRPNIVIDAASGKNDFVDNAWVGHVLAIGDAVRLNITGPCPRCVMTTLPQADLPKDTGILRTAAHHNRANVGVYAAVLQGGKIRLGDSVRLQ
jgi:uncharacterized protein YcbX